jgi:hypothetical protein
VIEEAEAVVHEADEPDLVGDLLDADVLAGDTLPRLILWRPKQIRPQRVTVRLWNG